MKKAAFVFCLLVASAFASESFWQSLTPEQRARAGLENLTPEQQAALDALAERYVSQQTDHAVTHAREKAIAEVRAVAKAEAKAEVKAELEAEKKANLGLAPKPAAADTETIHARIAGNFRGWGPGTTFRLDNGQVWVADSSAETRFFGLRENAEVEIRPAPFGTWKLYLVSEGLWVRVKRVQ